MGSETGPCPGCSGRGLSSRIFLAGPSRMLLPGSWCTSRVAKHPRSDAEGAPLACLSLCSSRAAWAASVCLGQPVYSLGFLEGVFMLAMMALHAYIGAPMAWVGTCQVATA